MASGCWEIGFEEQEMEVPEIDGEILTELLEETHRVEVEEEKVALDLMHPHEDCEDCGLDNILSDLDSHEECSKYYPTYVADDDPFDWVEMEMGDWYVDECVGDHPRGDYSSFYCYCYSDDEASMEQAVYNPLWE